MRICPTFSMSGYDAVSRQIYPHLFSTLLVPKTQELVATPYRFGGSKERAQEFFENGFGKAFDQMRKVSIPEFPLTVFYAFKQSESDEDEDEMIRQSFLNGLGNDA